MGWKDWPYWKKGGLIVCGSAIIILSVASILFAKTGVGNDELINSALKIMIFPFGYVIAFTLVMVLGFLTGFPGELNMTVSTTLVVLFLLVNIFGWFLIGALTGWIYEKIKSTK